MKRLLSLLISAALVLCTLSVVTLTVGAVSDTVDGFTWKFTIDQDANAILKAYDGDENNVPYGDIVIPTKLFNNGYYVTAIGADSFNGHSQITSVVIPDTVTSIGENAFANCTGLKSITIPDSVTSIGDNAFANCTALTSIVLPENLESIGNSVFSNCIKLSSVTMSDNVKTIGYGTFKKCTALKTISFSSGLVSIDSNAFDSCTGLTEITFPEGFTTIESSAFTDCIRLSKVNFSSTVKTIGSYAFNKCNSIVTINTPDSVTFIGEYAFYECDALVKATLSEGVATISDYAFANCDALNAVVIPSSLVYIGDCAFSGSDSCNLYYLGTKALWDENELYIRNSSKLVYFGDAHNCVAKNDEWTTDTDNHYNLCYCGKVISGTHTGGTATCTKKAVCEVCSLEYGEKLEHTPIESGNFDSTCTATGWEGKTVCDVCEEVLTEGNVVDVKAHTEEVIEAKAATCTSTGLTAGKKCSVCGTETVAQKEVAQKTHTYKTTTTKATLSKNGSKVTKCTVCGYKKSSSIIYKISSVKLAATTYSYTGKAISPAVTVKNSKGTKLVKGTDYTVSYASGRKNVGKYKVTMTFKGNYSGKKILYFTINPAKTTVKKLTPATKALKVSITKKSAQVSGYQIQYSTAKSFSGAKALKITGTSKTIKSLKANKTYYVRVRTYKKVGSKVYYSAWSTAKKAKTK